MAETKQRIKNKEYRLFLDSGVINLLDIETINKATNNIKKHKEQATALLLTLYYTGCRPAEALLLKPEDVKKERNYIEITFRKTLKNGLPRRIFIPTRNTRANEILSWAEKVPPEMPLFWAFRSRYVRTHKKKNGEVVTYTEPSAKLRYHFKKWFSFMEEPPCPYFLRHNRFSQLTMAGIPAEQLRLWKGARRLDSVMPYQHLSERYGKRIANKIR